MKKILTVFFMMFFVLMNVVSCSDTEPLSVYKVLACGYSDSVELAKYETKYSFADEETYKDKAAPQQVEITINKQKYVGDYMLKQYREVNYFPVYYYVAENGFRFEIDDQGRLISAFWGGEVEAHQNALLPDECKQIAIDFMQEIVDLSAYTVTVTEKPEDRQCEVLFQKYIGDFETSDQATVVVNMDGSLYSYSSFMLGRVPVDRNNDRIKKIDLSEIETAVYAELDNIYAESKEKYDRFEYEEIGVVLTVLKNGSWAFVYTVDIEASNTVGELSLISSCRINLVVELK